MGRWFKIIVTVDVLANNQGMNNVIFFENPDKTKQHDRILRVINIGKIPWLDYGEIPWVIFSVPEITETFSTIENAQNFACTPFYINIQYDYTSVENESESVSMRLQTLIMSFPLNKLY